MNEALLTTNLPLDNRKIGKVRDLYDIPLPDGTTGILIVTADRVSAFDVVMANGIPGRGIVLTQISRFWFKHFANIVTNHLISTDPADIPDINDEQRNQLDRRIMICKKTNVIPIECVARGYLTGSGWKDYQKTGTVCGIKLPPNMRNGDKIDYPIFTPATKAEQGHDETIDFDQAAQIAGNDTMTKLNDLTISIYSKAREFAFQRGIIIADTKLEFGIPIDNSSNGPILIDELLTPDSSRFWPVDNWQPGKEQKNFDKQYIRNYLQELCDAGRWDKTPPGPTLPSHVVNDTISRYLQAYEMLTSTTLTL